MTQNSIREEACEKRFSGYFLGLQQFNSHQKALQLTSVSLVSAYAVLHTLLMNS